ncbi:4-hydroxythreonine-4-phosphate dehydrogenase PdxA [bacterium]|nr:4-hydroxythreonine-4-phosphate dehydrogenase PdxA [bacterium]MCI0603047.1 4-hydroxythreonine-4-phosphate dehydrogenase PdxA [bacterium]
MQVRPRIGITLGDPGGIGPEVLLKALEKTSRRYTVFGSLRVLLHHAKHLRIPVDLSRLDLVDIDNVPKPYFGPSPEIAGQASIDYLDRAFDYFKRGWIDAVVTGPIHKESWHMSGYKYPGQTEYCAEKTETANYCMLMAGKKFRIALLSTHVSLKDALREVRQKKIVKKIKLIYGEFLQLGFRNPRIACAAVNPHAGEKGAFGREEMAEIEPALDEVRRNGIPVEGPIAPEVVFRVAATKSPWDVILAMYHDQAMIPLKLLEFENSANVTLGLPLIRTSPDHGTAFDIAGRGIAHPGSMIFAMRLASDWTKRRILTAKAPRSPR